MKQKHQQGEVSLVIPYHRPSIPSKQMKNTLVS
jgi:hypothetical protein